MRFAAAMKLAMKEGKWGVSKWGIGVLDYITPTKVNDVFRWVSLPPYHEYHWTRRVLNKGDRILKGDEWRPYPTELDLRAMLEDARVVGSERKPLLLETALRHAVNFGGEYSIESSEGLNLKLTAGVHSFVLDMPIGMILGLHTDAKRIKFEMANDSILVRNWEINGDGK